MKKFDVAAFVQILANIGVIAGIAFLALELRQNNALLEAQARTERAEIRRDGFNRYYENPILLTAAAKNQNGEPLSQEESMALRMAFITTIGDWEYLYGEYVAGLLPLAELRIEMYRAAFSRNPGFSEVWESQKGGLDPEFVQWVQEAILSE